MNLLKSRFEKEKSYWESLISSKEETIAQLHGQLIAERKKIQDLKSKNNELQQSQNELLNQSFGIFELQKRSITVKLAQLEDNLQAMELKLLDSEIAALDQMTAPPVQYPGWFIARLTDPKQQEALSQNPAALAAGASGS